MKRNKGLAQLAESLSQVAIELREQTRLSQRKFALAAGLGKNTITNLEGGKGGTTPATLRLIAETAVREAAGENSNASVEVAYTRLMVAAGFIDEPSNASTSSQLVQEDRPSFEEEVAALLKQIPDASIALTDLSRGANDWDEDDREFVLGRLRRLAERYGRSQTAG